jgi:PPOX class probable F420-dependent enzyme
MMTLPQTATPFPALVGHQYMSLTTFRKSGAAVPTPVWFVAEGGKLYVFTRPDSGKVKRVRANGRAEVAPSDARGTVLGLVTPGRARILALEEHAHAKALFVRKYGIQFRLFDLVGKLQRAQPAYLEIAPVAS